MTRAGHCCRLFVEPRMDRLTQAGRKIGLLNHVGGGNLGDEATLGAVADNIKRRWPNAEIVAFSMNPDDTKRRHGVRSFHVQGRGWTIGYKPIGYKPAGSKTVLKQTV